MLTSYACTSGIWRIKSTVIAVGMKGVTVIHPMGGYRVGNLPNLPWGNHGKTRNIQLMSE